MLVQHFARRGIREIGVLKLGVPILQVIHEVL